MDIEGQWFGAYEGENKGKIILNLDRRRTGYGGSASVFETDISVPSATYYVTIQFPDTSGKLSGHASLHRYFRIVGDGWAPLLLEQVRVEFPNLVEATELSFEGTAHDESINISFTTNAKTHGSATLRRAPSVPSVSSIEPIRISWADAKARLATLAQAQQIFRGQSRSFPLRTAFHRTGRCDLVRFANEDMNRLRKAIITATDTFVDTASPEILATVLGIAQHHGYPTPLMDWTASPYVAAYFAVRDAIGRNDASPTIFAFDRNSWSSKHTLGTDIGAPLPSLNFLNPIPWRNPRQLPQQSILVFCNVDNFENFIKHKSKEDNVEYLTAFRLEDSAAAVLHDLRVMGVHAPSLFPGLDGSCRGAFEESIEI